MPLLFPTYETVSNCFAPSTNVLANPRTSTNRSKYQARQNLYPAYSVVDDVKAKAGKLSDEAKAEMDKAMGKAEKYGDSAAAELQKASDKAQAKVGAIELYSPKFYAACTFGGLLACVSLSCN